MLNLPTYWDMPAGETTSMHAGISPVNVLEFLEKQRSNLYFSIYHHYYPPFPRFLFIFNVNYTFLLRLHLQRVFYH